MKFGDRIYQTAVAAKEYFERARIKPLVKLEVAAMSHIGSMP
jgi:hypothetical protein